MKKINMKFKIIIVIYNKMRSKGHFIIINSILIIYSVKRRFL